MFKKPKLTIKDYKKIDSQLDEQKKCLFCTNQKAEIKKCAELHNVKDNIKSVIWHILKCSDCKTHIKLMVDCKKNRHKAD